MVINMVIVDDNVDRGAEAGRSIAEHLHRTARNWKLSVHVRRNVNKLTDDHFERFGG